MTSRTPTRRRATAALAVGALVTGGLALAAPGAGASQSTVGITCNADGAITQVGNPLVAPSVVEGLEQNPIPLSLQVNTNAPAIIDVDEPITYELTITQDFPALAQGAFNEQVAPGIDALIPGASADTELNLHITNLELDLPIPAGTSLDGMPVVASTGPDVSVSVEGDMMTIALDPIGATGGGNGTNPGPPDRKPPGYVDEPFDVTLTFTVDTTEIPFGSSVALLPGNASFTFADWTGTVDGASTTLGGFNVGYQTTVAGGGSGNFACTPTTPGTPIFSTGVGTFPDVPLGHPFFDEISWLVQQGITTGYADDTFRPAIPISRQAMAAFIYRYEMGDGESVPDAPECTEMPFTDVELSNPFCGEIQWMKDMGLTTGFPDGSFGIANPISRQAMAAFLYRLSVHDHDHSGENGDNGHEGHSARTTGEIPIAPECTTAPFPDVPVANPFCGEIKWLVDAGITQGFADGEFKPTNPVSRQAMAAFLFRYDLFVNLPGNIIEVATEAGSFTTLLDLLDEAGLTETLEGEGPFTVFAPTDEAFEQLTVQEVAYLLANPELLESVLLYHVVPGEFTAEMLLDMDGENLVTASGTNELEVQVVGETVSLLDGAGQTVQVINVDIQASNGVIHVPESVLLPVALPVAPDAPTNVIGSPLDGAVLVEWDAPGDDGGAPITSYEVTASPGGETCSTPGDTLACAVGGLDNGTAYTFTVVATNDLGDSPASAPSAPVTPEA
ncbi:MAG: S-layer homology domain-containing protein [Acidimicrobiia bacterium]|nr:S-layer homology domain-containing protein [Acidimicrobiia bacterium]